ncbi:pilus assembly protein CpaE [Sedimentibacter acidaminivorans]|uniref:Pilus assembly protein CpaE n=1 Tax=Sedimentibacter acidaminivorans TaxID=913099 RepID=A0ABS4GBM8_9FIRM|nr:AAA family ATPase [Sedimentibacter acidaminivorans]MBP1924810.1 pilus assembly protein CpaE [Sedimentibacter acidaminivorans]
MKISILLISKMERNLSAIKKMINDEELSVIGESAGGSLALDKIENTSPNIIIMTLGAGDTDVLNLAERIILHRPRTFVILVAEHIDVEIMQSSIKVGCHNVIEFPTSAKDFAEYIKSVYNNESIRIKALSNNETLVWSSTVVTVFGAKGGLGKSTIAANLAVKLAAKRKKVVLVDLNLQFGDLHIFLDIEPKDTITELVQDVIIPNIDSVRSYMSVHSSGVHVLCAPKSPEYAELVSAEKVQSLLSLLRTYYDYVIIDTAPSFTEITMTAIESSSLIFFVTGLDISILKNSKLSISILESLQQTDKLRIIVNRAVDMNTITINDVKRIIGYPIWAKMPSDYKIAVNALNRGIPFVIGAPKSQLSQSISELVELLLNGSANYDILNKKKKNKVLGLF